MVKKIHSNQLYNSFHNVERCIAYYINFKARIKYTNIVS